MRKSICIILMLVLALILVSSCSNKSKENSTRLRFYTSNFVDGGDTQTGGMMIYGREFGLGLSWGKKVNQDMEFWLDNGDWQFFVIGWDGSAPLRGNVRCGHVGRRLEGGDEDIMIEISQDLCSDPAFGFPEFRQNDGAFKPLKLTTCSSHPEASEIACDIRPGIARSYRVVLPEFEITPKSYWHVPGIVTSCFNNNMNSDSISDIATDIVIPPGDLAQIVIKIAAFSEENCLGTVRGYVFPFGVAFGAMDGIPLMEENSEMIYDENGVPINGGEIMSYHAFTVPDVSGYTSVHLIDPLDEEGIADHYQIFTSPKIKIGEQAFVEIRALMPSGSVDFKYNGTVEFKVDVDSFAITLADGEGMFTIPAAFSASSTDLVLSVLGDLDAGLQKVIHVSKFPVTGKAMFVTNDIYNGNLGGQAGADMKCMQQSFEYNIYGDFKAWITGADAAMSPSNKFVGYTMKYSLWRGDFLGWVQVAADYLDLTDGTLAVSLDYDIAGIDISGGGAEKDFWTNTSATGDMIGALDTFHCKNWSSEGGTGRVGRPGDANWSDHLMDYGCSELKRIICIEQ